MASGRQESESIDKRNAAVMGLELDRRKLLAVLTKLVDGWNSIPEDAQVPEQLNDGRFLEAEALLNEIESR